MTTASLGIPPVPPRGTGNIRGTETFPAAAHHQLSNAQLRRNLGNATHTIRGKRLAVTEELPDWEDLRIAGEGIKNDVLSRLPDLLEQFEAAVIARGGVVHWAADADEANALVTRLVRETGSDEVIKVKSMATQEIGLNEHLESEGIIAHETDLAELIVQLGNDTPSHILVPAIHRNRAEIRSIFLSEMDGVDPDLDADPARLAEASRKYLRHKFMTVPVAVSGANFGIAETGTLAVVESEGNGRMCLTLPQTLITVMGIEKLLPTYRDLEVFLQLLPRSSTGERMNPYTSMWTGVTPGDGPQEIHVILLDNGRTATLADSVGRAALRCIRCSACLNVCPVYERTGGHAYGSTYPGPIGAVLTPQLAGMDEPHDPNATLPFASSLCGACFDACPVRIDIPSLLVELRHQKAEHARPGAEAAVMKAASLAMSSAPRWTAAQKAAGIARLLAGRKGRITTLPWPLSAWTAARDIAAPPKQTFRQWWGTDERREVLDRARRSGESS